MSNGGSRKTTATFSGCMPGPFREKFMDTLAFRVIGPRIVELDQQLAMLVGAHDFQICDWRFRICADTLEQSLELLC